MKKIGKERGSRLMRLALLASLLVTCGCHHASGAPLAGAGPVLRADRGEVEHDILVDGVLVSPSSKPLVVQRVRWYWSFTVAWTADEGAMVKAGDPVVRLDPAAIQKDLDEKDIEAEQERLKLDEAKIKGDDQIAEALADVEEKQFEEKKAELLVVDDETVSLNERKKQKLTVAEAHAALVRSRAKVQATRQSTKKDFEVQRLKVTRAQEELDEIKRGMVNMEMKAPQDGILTFPLYSGDSGWQKARAGASVGSNVTIAEVANTNDLVARLYVPEVDADGVAVGVPCELTLDIAPTEVFKAKVTKVAAVPNTPAERDGTKSSAAAQNVRQFEVMAELGKLPPLAVPGLSVRARITTIKKTGVLRVPVEVLSAAGLPAAAGDVPKPLAAGVKNATVLARRADGGSPWEERNLTLGTMSLSYAEVVSGLAEGEQVQAK